MKKRLLTVSWIAPLIFIFDQITKWFIVARFPIGSKLTVIPHFFDIVHVRNRGAAFGILSMWDSHWRDIFFFVLAAGALVFLFYFLKNLKDHEEKMVVPIGMILGGALGNVADRIARGSVVDFLSFHWFDKSITINFAGINRHIDLVWPAFNIADSAISVGVVCLLILMSRDGSRSRPVLTGNS